MKYSNKRSRKKNINYKIGYKDSKKLKRFYKQYGGAEDDYVDELPDTATEEEENITPEQQEEINDKEFSKASEALDTICKTEDEELQELLKDYEDDIENLNRLYDGDLETLVKINTQSGECSDMLSGGITEFSNKFFNKIEEVKSLTEKIKIKNEKMLEKLERNISEETNSNQ